MSTAVEIASQIRSGRRRATDVVRAALESAEASQGDLNAFTLIDHDGAIARADAIDILVDRGTDPGPLAGVPIALKDLIDQTGLPNTRGSGFPAETPTHSATVVRRLGASGAIIIGRTGLHEFAFGFTSENHWFGPVRNPWDIATSPGGSSGGSAAAVAAGVVPISIGTDTGGSVRVPASMCGIFGLKVTHGRVPLTGVYPLATSFDTVGPMATNSDDLAAAYLSIAGDDPQDPWSRPVNVERPRSMDSPQGLRLGIVRQWFEPPHANHIATKIATFVERCAAAGFTIVEIDDESLRPSHAVTMASRAEILDVHRDRFALHPDRYGPDVRKRLVESQGVTVDHMVESARWIARARGTVDRIQAEGFTIMVCPTVGVQAKHIGIDDVDIDGTRVFHRIPLAEFTAPINAIGVPALSVPIHGSGTPPVSVQLIGPAWSEGRLLSVSRWLEDHGLIGFDPPPLTF
jgi:Asp-tRNA(Asn)/Glu-tRNA(Gln) amidotransferase A subunit family amidase